VLVTGLSIGYAPVSTHDQDLTAQRDALAALDVAPDRIYVDHGLTGTNRDRPGLREAMAARRAGPAVARPDHPALSRSLSATDRRIPGHPATVKVIPSGLSKRTAFPRQTIAGFTRKRP